MLVRCSQCNKRVEYNETVPARLMESPKDLNGREARICEECNDYFERQYMGMHIIDREEIR